MYNISSQFNLDIVKCLRMKDPNERCYTLSECGFGGHLDESAMGGSVGDDGLSVHHTWQFSLERIIHQKLLWSPHRVHDPKLADIIYVPYYAAMDCICHSQDRRKIKARIQSLEELLEDENATTAGLPKMMTLGMIEHEHKTLSCPLLAYSAFQRFLFIGLEQESNKGYWEHKFGLRSDLITAPYPSYGHLNSLTRNPAYLSKIHLHPRAVFMFLAASTRRSNEFRAAILDQFEGDNKTSMSYEAYSRSRKLPIGQEIPQMWLKTPECYGKHHEYTLPWMYRSVFCLQPPGDSATRKSYYDAIISGCIPVIFHDEQTISYPFEDKFRLKDYTVILERHIVSGSSRTILQHLRLIKTVRIRELQDNLRKVVPSLQYDFPIVHQAQHKDALKMILDEVGQQIQSNHGL
jgi:hypothetical protein